MAENSWQRTQKRVLSSLSAIKLAFIKLVFTKMKIWAGCDGRNAHNEDIY